MGLQSLIRERRAAKEEPDLKTLIRQKREALRPVEQEQPVEPQPQVEPEPQPIRKPSAGAIRIEPELSIARPVEPEAVGPLTESTKRFAEIQAAGQLSPEEAQRQFVIKQTGGDLFNDFIERFQFTRRWFGDEVQRLSRDLQSDVELGEAIFGLGASIAKAQGSKERDLYGRTPEETLEFFRRDAEFGSKILKTTDKILNHAIKYLRGGAVLLPGDDKAIQEWNKAKNEVQILENFSTGDIAETIGFITSIFKLKSGLGFNSIASQAKGPVGRSVLNAAGTGAVVTLIDKMKGMSDEAAVEDGRSWAAMYLVGDALLAGVSRLGGPLLAATGTAAKNVLKAVPPQAKAGVAKILDKAAKVTPQAFREWAKTGGMRRLGDMKNMARNFGVERIYDFSESFNQALMLAYRQSESPADFATKFPALLATTFAGNVANEVVLDLAMGSLRLPGKMNATAKRQLAKQYINRQDAFTKEQKNTLHQMVEVAPDATNMKSYLDAVAGAKEISEESDVLTDMLTDIMEDDPIFDDLEVVPDPAETAQMSEAIKEQFDALEEIDEQGVIQPFPISQEELAGIQDLEGQERNDFINEIESSGFDGLIVDNQDIVPLDSLRVAEEAILDVVPEQEVRPTEREVLEPGPADTELKRIIREKTGQRKQQTPVKTTEERRDPRLSPD